AERLAHSLGDVLAVTAEKNDPVDSGGPQHAERLRSLGAHGVLHQQRPGDHSVDRDVHGGGPAWRDPRAQLLGLARHRLAIRQPSKLAESDDLAAHRAFDPKPVLLPYLLWKLQLQVPFPRLADDAIGKDVWRDLVK